MIDFRSEYTQITAKYRESLGLASYELVAKTWVTNSAEEEKKIADQFREQFETYRQIKIWHRLGQTSYDPVAPLSSVAQDRDLNLLELLSLYVLHEIHENALELVDQLIQEGEPVETISVRGRVPQSPVLNGSYGGYATILRLQPGSEFLERIPVQAPR